MTYDDERVVALLKETVPVVPDVPGRVDSVRRLATRQRTFAQMQAIGAVASVVLVVATVAAFLRPGGTEELRPVADPARVAREAFERVEWVSFEATTRTVHEGLPEEVRVVRGGGRTDGSAYFAEPVGDDGSRATRLRIVGGVLYRGPYSFETLPPGKRWVRDSASKWPSELFDTTALLDEPEPVFAFVRTTTVDGVAVAEYEATTSTTTGDLSVTGRTTLALDAGGLIRRLVVVSEVRGTRVTMTMTYSGFGEPVAVEAPPEAEVVDAAEVERTSGADRVEG